MTLKEYRLKNRMTVRKLTEELKAIDSRFTMSMVSNMENGVVEPPEEVKVWLAKKQIEMSEEPLSEAEDIVLRYLTGHYKDDPIARSTLKYWTGLTDRVMRDAIEKLRNRGYWIVNGIYGGYYLTNDPKDLEYWVRKERARASSINKTVRAMLSRMPGQMEMGKD